MQFCTQHSRLRLGGQVASEETVDSVITCNRSSIGMEEFAAHHIKEEQSQISIGNRREYLSGESIKKRKRSISSSYEEVSVIKHSESSEIDEIERPSGPNANLKLGNEANNNRSKSTEDIQDLEGEKVVARVKARLAKMEEKAKVGDGDEALTLKIQLVREKLMNMKREIERKSLRQSYEPLKKRDGTPKSSLGSETSSDDESSSGSDECKHDNGTSPTTNEETGERVELAGCESSCGGENWSCCGASHWHCTSADLPDRLKQGNSEG